MNRFTLRAPAKLNLLLGVSSHVSYGRHTLISIYSTIDLGDYLSFSFDGSQKREITIEVVSSPGIAPLNLPTEQNIVYKAITTLEAISGRKLDGHLKILIEKSIPYEAGLAGGSSDAAATLLALASIWSIDPFGLPVLEAAQKLGADVPYFLYGGCLLMGGGGDKFIRRLPQPSLDLVLVKPEAGISTAAAYAAFDADPQPVPSSQRLVLMLESKNAPRQLIAEQLANNLSKAAYSLLPELETLTDEIAVQSGVHKALITGSGSAVFGVCESAEVALRIAAEFTEKGYWSTAAMTV